MKDEFYLYQRLIVESDGQHYHIASRHLDFPKGASVTLPALGVTGTVVATDDDLPKGSLFLVTAVEPS